MTYRTKENIRASVKAVAAIAGIFGLLYVWQDMATHDFENRHDAVYKAIATAHGWNSKYLSDYQDSIVEEETAQALMDANISPPDDR